LKCIVKLSEITGGFAAGRPPEQLARHSRTSFPMLAFIELPLIGRGALRPRSPPKPPSPT
jgi:hypothetical protein